MTDTFFQVTKCQRCGDELGRVRTMSWFQDIAICMSCKEKEQKVRKQLPQHGLDYEGCGYLPTVGEST